MSVGISVQVEYKKAQAAVAKFGHQLEPRKLLAAIGNRHLGWVAENFKEEGAELKWPPLSPNTIAARRGGGGGARILQDTGRMRMSFVQRGVRVQGNTEVSVGTEDKRAEWHDQGTAPYVIHPRKAKRMAFKTANGLAFALVVHHPGLPKRPLIPSEKLGEELATGVIRAIADKAADEANR